MYYFYHHSYFILVFSNPQIISKVKDKKKKVQFRDISHSTGGTRNMYNHPGKHFGNMLSNHSLSPLQCVYIYTLNLLYSASSIPIYQEKWRHHVARTEFTTNLAPALKLIFTFRIFILIQIFHNSYTVNILYCIISTHNSYLHKLI